MATLALGTGVHLANVGLFGNDAFRALTAIASPEQGVRTIKGYALMLIHLGPQLFAGQTGIIQV